MSGKKSTPKRRPKKRAKVDHSQHKKAYYHLLGKIEDLEKRLESYEKDRDWIFIALENIRTTLSYNQIYPEPKNRWIPSLDGDEIWEEFKRIHNIKS